MSGGKDRGRHADGKHRADRFRIPTVQKGTKASGKVYGTAKKQGLISKLFGGKK